MKEYESIKMENNQNFNKFSYKYFNNEKIEKDDLDKEIVENRLSLRKKKLYQILLQKRENYNTQNNHINAKENQLKEVSILIHKNTFEEIQTGLNIFYDFLINNEKLEKTHVKYIYENIYYRLLNLITCEKNIEKNRYMNKVLFLINYLTTENNIFIEPITENVFLSQFKELIEININNNLFVSLIIPVLSNMLVNKKKFSQIMKQIDISKIIKIAIEQKIDANKENIEILLILMNNFIININENKTWKFQFILKYALSFFNDNIKNYLNNDDESLIILNLLDILIYMSIDPQNLELIKSNNCIQFIKYIIDNFYKQNIIINNNDNNIKYLIKCEDLLGNILLNSKNYEDKKNIVSYIYSNLNDLNEKNLPFMLEFINSITNKNFPLARIILKCIISLIDNCIEFCEFYCNIDFINYLLKLFSENIQKKLKNEIIIFFINIIECDDVKIYKLLLNSDIISMFVLYIDKKKKTKKESTKVIIFNILLFIKKCLMIEEKNNMNIIKNILDKYKYKEIIEFLIENKDESISDISRNTFIKYFSETENTYEPNKINIMQKEEENMDIE